MEDVRILEIHNPFEPEKRETRFADAGKPLSEYLPDMDVDCIVFLNGQQTIDRNIIVKNKSEIIIKPRLGKAGGWIREAWDATTDFVENNLPMVLGVALAVVTGGASLLVSGAITLASMGTALTMASIGYGVGSYAGDKIQESMGWGDYSGNHNLTETATYSWNSQNMIAKQGVAQGITYGTVKPAPVVLAQHVSASGADQFLNLLLCGGDGPIDRITNVRLNANPIENYEQTTALITLGAPNQAPLNGFDNLYYDQFPNMELNNNEQRDFDLAGDNFDALEVRIYFPNGLYQVEKKTGQYTTINCITTIYISYDSGAWETFHAAEDITRCQKEAFSYSWVGDVRKATNYTVRVVQSQVGDSDDYQRSYRCMWAQLSGIVRGNYSRPSKVLVGIKACATGQLSGGMPKVDWLQTRATVIVWDPSETPVLKPADNPAWAAYDLIVRCKKHPGNGLWFDLGVPHSNVIYNDFKAWADFCDSKNLKCNYFIDAMAALTDVLKPICAVGRGAIILRGTKFGCIYDSVAEPVQMFTMGNIISGSFKEKFMALDGRATSVEITLNNAEKDYQRDMVVVYGDNYDAMDGIQKPAAIVLNACTSADQAYRHGYYYLQQNKYLGKVASWEADVDSIASTVGDVVLFQHDVPEWGEGGRLSGIISQTQIQLDKQIPYEAGTTYNLTIRQGDDEFYKYSFVATTTETTDILTVPDTTTLDAYDLYAIYDINHAPKLFRILTLTRAEAMTRKITALEYIAEVYDEKPVPDLKTQPVTALADPFNPMISQNTWMTKDLTQMCELYIVWQAPRNGIAPVSYDVYLSTDGSRWNHILQTADTTTTVTGVAPKLTYWAKIVSRRGFLQSPGAVTESVITGKDKEPPDVQLISAEQLQNRTKRFTWLYDAPLPDDTMGFEIRLTNQKFSTIADAWNAAQPISDTLINHSPFETAAILTGQYTVMIKALDFAGNYSKTAAATIVDFSAERFENILTKLDCRSKNWFGIISSGHIENGVIVADTPGGSIVYSAEFDPGNSVQTLGQLLITPVFDGNCYIYYSFGALDLFWHGENTDNFWQGSDDDNFWANTGDGMVVPYTSKVQVNTVGKIGVTVVVESTKATAKLKDLTIICDLPDVNEFENNVVIPVEGLEWIPTDHAYPNAIKALVVNPHIAPGSPMITSKYTLIKKDIVVNGKTLTSWVATIFLIDTSGNNVGGTADIQVFGY
ncbi:MAG: phage tail protein [Bacillota bacterium]